MDALLEIRDLKVSFRKGEVRRLALDGVSFSIDRKKTLGIVGESGCGKSLTALAIMQLLPRPEAEIDSGSILYSPKKGGDPIDIAAMTGGSTAMRRLRGSEIAMIFQEPMTSLDPVYRIGDQICEMIMQHNNWGRTQAMQRAVDLLRLVGVPSPEERVHQYPHEFSGGMRQRVVIAIAMACDPSLLIADEPTTALDVTVQAQVIDLMREVQMSTGSAIMFISHDIGVISQIAHNVVVMYLGRVVESGTTEQVVYSPAHPYTAGLIRSIPTLDTPLGQRIEPIAGVVPQIGTAGKGCRFRFRCPHAFAKCDQEPPMLSAGDGHAAACWLLEDIA